MRRAHDRRLPMVCFDPGCAVLCRVQRRMQASDAVGHMGVAVTAHDGRTEEVTWAQ